MKVSKEDYKKMWEEQLQELDVVREDNLRLSQKLSNLGHEYEDYKRLHTASVTDLQNQVKDLIPMVVALKLILYELLRAESKQFKINYKVE